MDVEDAEALWADALDGPGVTNTERATLRYILENLKMSKAGKSALENHLSVEEVGYVKYV